MKSKKTHDGPVEPMPANKENRTVKSMPLGDELRTKPELSRSCENFACYRKFILPSGRVYGVWDDYTLDFEIDWTQEKDFHAVPGKMVFVMNKGVSWCGKPAIVYDNDQALCAVCAGRAWPNTPRLTIDMLEAEMDRYQKAFREEGRDPNKYPEFDPPLLGTIPAWFLKGWPTSDVGTASKSAD